MHYMVYDKCLKLFFDNTFQDITTIYYNKENGVKKRKCLH